MQFSHSWLQKHFDEKIPKPEDLGVVVGLHAFEYEGLDTEGSDPLIDWDVLPNRSSDCLSYHGLAREISAVLDIPYTKWIDSVQNLEPATDISTEDMVKLTVESDELVPRATKRVAVDVQVGDSPKWLQERLAAIGQRSINNVVDITNYVMWETGQPVHAFDYDKIAGEEQKEIVIRAAHEHEMLTDLTGVEHELEPSILVIADSDGALDIAGIKGGALSGVDENTKTVLLSACNFDFRTIRSASRKLKLQTDASKRFENEVPLSKIDDAMKLFSYLLQEYAGAKITSDMCDTKPNVPGRPPVMLSVGTTNSILGTYLTSEDIVGLLERLECEVITREDEFEVIVPSDRLDLNFAGDLIEEVGRLYGYENLEPAMPEEGFDLPVISEHTKAVRKISDVLVQSGFYEVKTRTLTKDGAIGIANPLNKNAGALRSELLSGLSQKVEKNLAYDPTPRLFEIGKVFTGINDKEVQEHWSFAGVVGQLARKEKNQPAQFLQTKGALQAVLEALSIADVQFVADDSNGSLARIEIDGEALGEISYTSWEINLDTLITHIDKTVDYHKPSKYPRIERDVALFVTLDTEVATVEQVIRKELPEESLGLELFDVFEKEDKKSLAFRIVFQSDSETLSDEWANGVMSRVHKALGSLAGAEVR